MTTPESPKTLAEIAELMRDIDICTLSTLTPAGAIAARPMRNNCEVDFNGDSWFFTFDNAHTVPQIEANPNVGVTYQGSAGIKAVLGKPGPFVHVEARAELIRDKAEFARHWHAGLDYWFKDGIDTPGIVLIHARATSIHYWDGMDDAEISVPANV